MKLCNKCSSTNPFNDAKYNIPLILNNLIQDQYFKVVCSACFISIIGRNKNGEMDIYFKGQSDSPEYKEALAKCIDLDLNTLKNVYIKHKDHAVLLA